ncbi:MAG: oligosaccharide flippase family protein [Enterococcus avium]
MKVIKNIIYQSLNNILLAILPLITVPYVSRILGPSLLGIYSFSYTVVYYFVMIAGLGTVTYGSREIAAVQHDETERNRVFWEIYLLRVFITVIVYAIFLIFNFLIFDKSMRIFYLIQSIMIASVLLDISWLFIGMEDFKKILFRNILVKGFSVIAIFIFVHQESDLWKYIFINASQFFVGNITFWPSIRKYVGKIQIKKKNFKHHFINTVFLFIPTIASQTYLLINKNMIGVISGVTELGFYDQSDKVMRIVVSLVTSIGVALMPRTANLFARNELNKVNSFFFQSLDAVSGISFGVAFGLAAVSTKFSILFFGPEYASVGTLLINQAPLIIILAMQNVVGNQYLIATKQNRSFIIATVLTCVINIMSNLILIPLFGNHGAIIGSILAEVIGLIYMLIVINKNISISSHIQSLWKYILCATSMFIPVYYLNIKMSSSIKSIVIQVIIGVFIYCTLNFVFKTKLALLIKKQILKKFNNYEKKEKK